MSTQNSMGSEVTDGFTCKPKVLDENKPIMFSALHILICEGDRCREVQSNSLVNLIRDLVKELGLSAGENRVKVTRTQCNGACRFKSYAYVYKHPKSVNYNSDLAFTAWKKVDQFTLEDWKDLICSLSLGKEPSSIIDYRVEEKVYDTAHEHKR